MRQRDSRPEMLRAPVVGSGGAQAHSARGASPAAVVVSTSGQSTATATGGVSPIRSLTLPGGGPPGFGQETFSIDGSLALVTVTAPDADTGGYLSRTVLINTTTGLPIGPTVKLPAATYAAAGPPQFNTTGTRAVISAFAPDPANPGAYISRVVLLDTTTGAQIGATVKVAGRDLDGALFSADGRRAVVSTVAPNVTNGGSVLRTVLLDTATGGQVGAAVSLVGDGSARFTEDSTRVVITAAGRDVGTGDAITRTVLLAAATGVQVGATLRMPGIGGQAQVASDSTRAVVTTQGPDSVTGASTTRIVLLDLGTGAQVGATLKLAGSEVVGAVQISSNSKRVAVSTYGADAAAGAYVTRIVLIDTATGTQVGTTTKVAGSGGAQFSSDSARALVSTYGPDSATGAYVTRIVLIDTATGTQVGTTTKVAGSGGAQFSPNGSRVLVVTTADDAAGGATTRTVLLNATTGAQIGATMKLDGAVDFVAAPPRFSSDNSRALVTTSTLNPTTLAHVTQTVLIDLGSGARVGAPIKLAGLEGAPNYPGALPRFSADATRAVVTATSRDATTLEYTTRVAVLSAATGAQTGATFKLPGNLVTALVSTDGKRAFVVTTARGSATGAWTTRVAAIDTATGAQIGTTFAIIGGVGGGASFNVQDTRALVTTFTADATTGATTTATFLRIV
ncbi:hypothetical protein [Mycobacterium sp. shizuoka-1]|uniref:hypothetical protein n=1 Tax=Mycobacterium sp. shizuoka-1 TaxID=2039281 RepID=UPI00115B08B7|nr:hypothetical protein [Mycobacterium sp. shizuoka-1]